MCSVVYMLYIMYIVYNVIEYECYVQSKSYIHLYKTVSCMFMYIIQCTLYNVLYTMYIILYTLYNVHYTIYNEHNAYI